MRANDEWISLAEVARRRGVTRQAVCMRVRKLAGAIEVRRARKGNERLINVGQYERLTGHVVPTHAQRIMVAAALRVLTNLPADWPSPPALIDCTHEQGGRPMDHLRQAVLWLRAAWRIMLSDLRWRFLAQGRR